MRKTYLCGLVCVILLVMFFLMQSPKSKLLFDGGENYTFYVGGTNSNAQIITTEATNASYYKQTLGSVGGESTIYSNKSEALKLINKYNCTLVQTEQCGGVISYYYYSPMLDNYIIVAGKKVNLHIAVNNSATVERVAVGSPIIFGGF